ncbi:histidine kinase [Pararhodobacter marinus]|uniref:Histidine kinase n=1 Tax=Pararhodobacter marinus TaxID=2184063 RepID=A0A2U2C9J4_9RHOB|nr:putative nucleotidyltransferase substrate binding domain-containing protein [Pararhodobacter marinus]PWE28521.1 histidine kinase [Pararhodobacter marinus]
MEPQIETIIAFLETVHPYDSLPRNDLVRVATSFGRREYRAGDRIYEAGEPLKGLYLIKRGSVEVTDRNGVLVSILGPRNTFGERGLMRDGLAVTTAAAVEPSVVLLLPEAEWRTLIAGVPAFERFFNRSRPAETRGTDLSTLKVSDLMARTPVTLPPDASVTEAAQIMRDRHISSIAVTRGEALKGLITTRDLAERVLAAELPGSTLLEQVMTPDPLTLTPDALGSDILHTMLERGIGHVPVVQDGKLKGIITQTDLTRFQAVSSALLVRDVAACETPEEMAEVTARIPRLLQQLVAAHNAHEVVTRLITDIADTVTRRLLKLAEAQLGPAPVPYLWLACGSQGRQEQTGVSDQDNCLILDDAVTPDDRTYFKALARFVSDGLNTAGYVYCPGDMMATAERWCQPKAVWRRYFRGWIDTPSPEAQMLASVMFDLRPIGGTTALFRELQEETLALASKNSIFVAHMIANSLKHHPPLGLLRGFATIRSGEYKNHIDMKHNGVVPVADIARVYALRGELTEVNTRARIEAAEDAGVVSVSGARDLIEAYDLIASLRLENQAALVKAGRKPDNYLAPSDLSDFERSHLRDAFVVVRTMQSALSQRSGVLG